MVALKMKLFYKIAEINDKSILLKPNFTHKKHTTMGYISFLDEKMIVFRELETEDYPRLEQYFAGLSNETKRRYAPHGFDLVSIQEIFQQSDYLGYIAEINSENKIIAYAIIKLGIVDYDKPRFEKYGLVLDTEKDCTYAPSVADAWQGKKVGVCLFRFIKNHLIEIGRTKIYLWGGVQKDNMRARKYYINNGFTDFGEFEHNGMNVDMSYEL